jgi:hypothetical protein
MNEITTQEEATAFAKGQNDIELIEWLQGKGQS